MMAMNEVGEGRGRTRMVEGGREEMSSPDWEWRNAGYTGWPPTAVTHRMT